jgi:hypothetical protein
VGPPKLGEKTMTGEEFHGDFGEHVVIFGENGGFNGNIWEIYGFTYGDLWEMTMMYERYLLVMVM